MSKEKEKTVTGKDDGLDFEKMYEALKLDYDRISMENENYKKDIESKDEMYKMLQKNYEDKSKIAEQLFLRVTNPNFLNNGSVPEKEEEKEDPLVAQALAKIKQYNEEITHYNQEQSKGD